MAADVQRSPLDVAIAASVACEPDVLAAWLFGSRARGEERATSDADVALLLAPGASRDVLSRLSATLTSRLGADVDVVDLATSTPVLGFEIVAHGRRLYVRDARAGEAADEAEERCLRGYLDTEHMRRVQHHYLYGDPL